MDIAIKDFIESKGCELLSIVSNKRSHKILTIISSCGHESNVLYHNFRLKGTGILCKACVQKTVAAKNKYLSSTVETQSQGIQILYSLLSSCYNIEFTREGCEADILIRHNKVDEDLWYGIQLKTTYAKNKYNQYSFAFQSTRKNKDCILLFCAIEEKKLWCLPKSYVLPKSRLNIGTSSASKYNMYEVLVDDLNVYIENILHQYVPSDIQSWNISTQRCTLEDYFVELRKTRLDFLNFIRPHRNQTHHDFLVNGFKNQEKSISLEGREKQTVTFTLKKNNGTRRTDTGIKRQFIPYDIGDNDFYWLWCKESPLFYIIPERILVDNCIIGTSAKGYLTIPKRSSLPWIHPYTFNIEDIDEARIKRLFCL